MFLKNGDAIERITLETRKSTLSLERKMMSALASLKGYGASRVEDIESAVPEMRENGSAILVGTRKIRRA